MDALFGAFRAYLEGTFTDRVFVVSFVSNVLIAALIVFVGDQIGVGSQLSTGRRRGARHPHLHQRRRHPTGAVPCLSRRIATRGADRPSRRAPVDRHDVRRLRSLRRANAG